MEKYAFVHFSMNTFMDVEWGYGDVSAKHFNPTDLDCKQWVKLFKASGLKGVILTAKHHDGFCLWPSKYTDYSVKNSPWKDGKGDLVRELSDACRQAGLKFGIYLSPWDRNHADYGTSKYLTYFRNQLTELLTNYGDIFEVWFDGANGGDGYYGGARETRKVNRRTYYNWPSLFKLVKKLQPKAVIFGDGGPGCRWCGDEEGWVGQTNWSTLYKDSVWNGYPHYKELRYGHKGGDMWVPAEVNVSVRPGWFYHTSEDHKVKTVEQLVDFYYQSVGRNGTLLLNFPIDKRGWIHEIESERMLQMTTILARDFKDNLAPKAAEVTASSIRMEDEYFAPEKVIDDNGLTYWVPSEKDKKPFIQLNWDAPITFNRLMLQEFITLGQRVSSFQVEVLLDGAWKVLDQQTTIGYKRILRLPTTSTKGVRVTILSAAAVPLLSHIGVYNAPKLLVAPTLHRNQKGFVALRSSDPEATLYYTLDGTDPTSASKRYTAPFIVRTPIEVRAISADEISGDKSEVTAHLFTSDKRNWCVFPPTEETKSNDPSFLFDGEESTTYMQTQKELPINLILDLGSKQSICGFTYLPDQARWSKGIILGYRFYTSLDNQHWSLVKTGDFSNIKNHPILQTETFPSVEAHYVKFQAIRTTDGTAIAGYAEFEVLVSK
ncbi:MAG: alpha-L-fucosidase [Bacteroidaceae bacterium]|nr:alpha-L-fucosidase [Bacteroidaceae bacterium]